MTVPILEYQYFTVVLQFERQHYLFFAAQTIPAFS